MSARDTEPIARSIGMRIKGYSPPMADSLDASTILAGAKFRFCRKHVPANKRYLKEVKVHVRDYCEKNFDPIQYGTVLFYEYLDQTTYSVAKKMKLIRIYESQTGHPSDFRYGSFGKTETLSNPNVFKHVRCINGPCDEWKVYAAPYIHAVEKVVCKDRHFAKYIPVIDRPKAIYDRLSGFTGPYYVTDYTSFESSFVPDVLEAIECELYDYMLQNYPEASLIIRKQLIGKHKCRFKGFDLSVEGVRMSGDCNTSLGNGFANLMLMSFNAKKQGLLFDGFVEGDDGLFAFSGPVKFDIINDLGFTLKLEPHNTLYSTSFVV